MRMKKWFIYVGLGLFGAMLSIASTACFGQSGTSATEESETHTHVFTAWETETLPTCTSAGVFTRGCEDCSYTETQPIAPIGHIAVTDEEVPPTCATEGKTAGSHCGVCGEILTAQRSVEKGAHRYGENAVVIRATCVADGVRIESCLDCGVSVYTPLPATEHTPVIDEAIAATCTADGKTAGSHCDVCGKILTAQARTFATGHTLDEGEILTEATCLQAGSKLHSCTLSTCDYAEVQAYTLTAYTANEVYNQAVQYVGEVKVCNQYGTYIGLGSGFVYSADGKVVTNYHVIKSGYTAKFTIGGAQYDVTSILAYDEDIDLAILQTSGRNLTPAPICKSPVNVGDTVYAIGSSRGYTNTFSQGIVTYANRVVNGVSHVQIDASITNGNSGGPLINEYGEVIGINTWGILESQNLNFSVATKELDNLSVTEETATATLYTQATIGALKAHLAANEYKAEQTYSYADGTTLLFTLQYDTAADRVYVTCTDSNSSAKYYTEMDLDVVAGATYAYKATYGTISGYTNTYTQQNSASGKITPSTFHEDIALPYDTFSGQESNKDALLQNYALCLANSVKWLSTYFSEENLGLSVAHFGFTAM